jgi:hypothetical protein
VSDHSDLNRDISPFEQLVMMLASSAMQHLGKLVNPQSGRAEADLEGAAWTIDLLGMLEEKTRGNLSDHETRTLGEALTTLRLNYVEAASAAPAEPAAPEAPAPKDIAPEETTTDKGKEVEAKDAGEEPRFHKTYG